MVAGLKLLKMKQRCFEKQLYEEQVLWKISQNYRKATEPESLFEKAANLHCTKNEVFH